MFPPREALMITLLPLASDSQILSMCILPQSPEPPSPSHMASLQDLPRIEDGICLVLFPLSPLFPPSLAPPQLAHHLSSKKWLLFGSLSSNISKP